MASSDRELPPNWIKKESKSKPGRFYYANKKTGVSVWRIEHVFAGESSGNVKQDIKISCKKSGPKLSSAKSERPSNIVSVEQKTSYAAGPSKSESSMAHTIGLSLSPTKCSEKIEKNNRKSWEVSQRNLNRKSLTTASEVSKNGHSTSPLLSRSGVGYYFPAKGNAIIPKTKSQTKVEEQEAKFEQLVTDSSLNSEYIDLESPPGSKDVRPIRNLGKFTGPKACLVNKNNRFVPFKVSSVKQVTREEQTKRSKSDQNPLFGKPRVDKSVERKPDSLENSIKKPAQVVRSDSNLSSKTAASATFASTPLTQGKFKSCSDKSKSYSDEFKSCSNKSKSYSDEFKSYSNKSKSYSDEFKSYSSKSKSYSDEFKSHSNESKSDLEEFKSDSGGSKPSSNESKSHSKDLKSYSSHSKSNSSDSKQYSKEFNSFSSHSKPYSRVLKSYPNELKPYSREIKSNSSESKPLSDEVKCYHNKIKSRASRVRSYQKEVKSSSTELKSNLDDIKFTPSNAKSYFYKFKSYSKDTKSAANSDKSATSPTRVHKSPANTQRVLSYSLDGDWEMVSDEEVEEGGDNDLNLISFALNSDVVMADSVTPASTTAERLRKDLHQFQAWVCVVMDTCSMGNLQNLLDVKSIQLTSTSSGQLVEHGIINIVIPWQVLQEMDHLKDNKANTFSASKSQRARRVARLIHSRLRNKDSLLKLQSPLDDALEINGFRINTEDDHIIKCCLSLRNKFSSDRYAVLLVTEDINLINKSSACDLLAFKYNELDVTLKCRPKMADVPEAWAEKQILTKLEVPDTERASVSPTESMPELYPASTTCPSATTCQHEDTSSVSALAAVTSTVSMPTQKISEALDTIEKVLKPILSKCLTDEMCAVFGDVWMSVIYRAPPWNSIIPILECFHKHWMAVFGLVVVRHSSKYVKTLLDTYTASTNCLTSDQLTQTVIAATALLRSLDRANRGYSADARAAIAELTDLLKRYENGSPENDEVPAGGRSSDVGAQLTEIFTQLGVNCDNVSDSCGARQASEVVFSLGVAYNTAVSQSADSSHVADFYKELNKVAQLLSIEATFTVEELSGFITNNRELMLEGLSRLEHIATILQSLL